MASFLYCSMIDLFQLESFLIFFLNIERKVFSIANKQPESNIISLIYSQQAQRSQQRILLINRFMFKISGHRPFNLSLFRRMDERTDDIMVINDLGLPCSIFPSDTINVPSENCFTLQDISDFRFSVHKLFKIHKL